MRIFLLLFVLSFAHAKHCTFIPPLGWEIAQLKTPSPHIKIGFLGKGSSEFRPSINLALEEEVDVPLKEYVKAVKELQAADPTSKWRDLGPFPTHCGNGQLIEISNSSPWGEIKVLQLLFVEDETAYILTAAVLKDDFLSLQKEILQSFRTLSLTDSLFEQIENVEKRQHFTSFFRALGKKEKDLEWENLQKEVAEHKSLGPYWAFLVLQEGHARIYSSTMNDSNGNVVPSTSH